MAIEGSQKSVENIKDEPRTEDVVAHLHQHSEELKIGAVSPNEKFLSELRADIGRLDSYPVFKEYLEEQVPTLSVLAESSRRAVATMDTVFADWAAHGIKAEDLKEEMKMKNLISGRLEAVRWDIATYIGKLIQFHNIKTKFLDPRYEGDPDLKEQFEKVDAARRRAHESLLLSLGIMTATVLKAAEEDLLEGHMIIEWVQGMSAHALMKNPAAIVVFSPSIFRTGDAIQARKNRSYIRDWAIAADFDEQFRAIASFADSPDKKN